MTVMNALQCASHIAALWTTDTNVYMRYCIYVYPFVTGLAISNFLLDLIVLVIPLPQVSTMLRYQGGDLMLNAA